MSTTKTLKTTYQKTSLATSAPTRLPWQDPLSLANTINETYSTLAFLYSGLNTKYSGRFSYLAYDVKSALQSEDMSLLSSHITQNAPRFDNTWFGYLGYGLKNSIESLTEDAASFITLPNLWLCQYHQVIEWDHHEQTMTLWSSKDNPQLPLTKPIQATIQPSVIELTSNMIKEEYLDKVDDIISRIMAGDLYQANLTRKFVGRFDEKPSAFQLFHNLSKFSPAPYSAFLKYDNTSIISSSPEQFLSIDPSGKITTRPIKGTMNRGLTVEEDNALKEQLQNSEKDRAENLMIVDLMRNDLSKAAKIDSVKVNGLYDIDSYATIHHMSSSVEAEMADDATALDVIESCFPPGSMTGTPKIKAMEVCSELEQQSRGVYSGAIGWFGGDGMMDLSVVIRTLIVQDNIFEFQVGGAIVADSDPQLEWQETITKASAIAKTLSIPQTVLEAL